MVEIVSDEILEVIESPQTRYQQLENDNRLLLQKQANLLAKNKHLNETHKAVQKEIEVLLEEIKEQIK